MEREYPVGSSEITHNPGRHFFEMAAQDIESLFVHKLGVLSTEEVREAVNRTEFLFVPGQAIYKGVTSMNVLTENHPIITDIRQGKLENLSLESIVRVAKVLKFFEGIAMELFALGQASPFTKKSFVRLYAPLAPALLVPVNPEVAAMSAALFELFTLISVPHTTYHEMMHQFESSHFRREFGTRTAESFTDFFVEKVAESSNSKLARYTRQYNKVVKASELINPFASNIAQRTFAKLRLENSSKEVLKQMFLSYSNTQSVQVK